MTIIALLAGVIALVAVAATLVSATRDGRGGTPPPTSRAVDADALPPALRVPYHR